MMMEYGLPDTVVAAIRGALAKVPAVERAIIYGSRAKGNYRPNSDIDLTLEGENIAFRDMAALDGLLDDLLLPWSIDLSERRQLKNPALLQEIEQYGKVFFTSSSAGGVPILPR